MASYDPLAALITWLKTQSTLTAQTSTRIWGGKVPRSEQVNMPRKCLSILRMGGPGPDRQVPDGLMTAACRCYGADPVEATAVYQALFDVVVRKHHLRPAAGQLLVTLAIEGEPVDMEEPGTAWPFVWVNMEVRYTTDVSS